MRTSIIDRARAMFALALAALAGTGEVQARVRGAGGWYGIHPSVRSSRRVAMDKRAATKARNKRRTGK